MNLSEDYKYATETSSKLESARKLRRGGGSSSRSGGRSSYSSRYSGYSSNAYVYSFHLNFGGYMYTYYYGYAYYGNIYRPSCFPEDVECIAQRDQQRKTSIGMVIVLAVVIFVIILTITLCCLFMRYRKRKDQAPQVASDQPVYE